MLHLLALLLAATPMNETAVSPDGRWRATVRMDRPGTEERDGLTSLWLTDTRSGASRLLLQGVEAAAPERDTAEMSHPRWSLYGRSVYVEASAWATSPAIHRVDAATGRVRFVTGAAMVGIISSGPYHGALMTQPHRYFRGRGSYDPLVLVRPDGREILQVPGTIREDETALPRWLRRHRWTMR